MPVQMPLAGRNSSGTCGERLGVDRREQAGLFDQHHGRRILGEEHVGRRVGALLDDLVGHQDVGALADRDRDAGLGGEGVGPFLGQRGVLGRVDDEPGILREARRDERGDSRDTDGEPSCE